MYMNEVDKYTLDKFQPLSQALGILSLPTGGDPSSTLSSIPGPTLPQGMVISRPPHSQSTTTSQGIGPSQTLHPTTPSSYIILPPSMKPMLVSQSLGVHLPPDTSQTTAPTLPSQPMVPSSSIALSPPLQLIVILQGTVLTPIPGPKVPPTSTSLSDKSTAIQTTSSGEKNPKGKLDPPKEKENNKRRRANSESEAETPVRPSSNSSSSKGGRVVLDSDSDTGRAVAESDTESIKSIAQTSKEDQPENFPQYVVRGLDFDEVPDEGFKEGFEKVSRTISEFINTMAIVERIPDERGLSDQLAVGQIARN
jgi:hypothetical protein